MSPVAHHSRRSPEIDSVNDNQVSTVRPSPPNHQHITTGKWWSNCLGHILVCNRMMGLLWLPTCAWPPITNAIDGLKFLVCWKGDVGDPQPDSSTYSSTHDCPSVPLFVNSISTEEHRSKKGEETNRKVVHVGVADLAPSLTRTTTFCYSSRSKLPSLTSSFCISSLHQPYDSRIMFT